MVRTQIQLTEKQARKVRAIARDSGVSVAEVLRRAVDSYSGRHPESIAERYARARKLVGALHDPKRAKNLSTRHDDALEDAFR